MLATSTTLTKADGVLIVFESEMGGSDGMNLGLRRLDPGAASTSSCIISLGFSDAGFSHNERVARTSAARDKYIY